MSRAGCGGFSGTYLSRVTEHKAFQIKLVTIAATIGIAAVGAAVAALGGKAGFGSCNKGV